MQTFAPVARIGSIRLLAALSTRFHMKIHQIDVKTAYLNGILDESVYMEVPEGFKDSLERIVKVERNKEIQFQAQTMIKELNSDDKICKLYKALYGLKQASRQWHITLDDKLKKLGVTPIKADPCVYIKGEGKEILMIIVYVDDIIIASKNLSNINNFKHHFSQFFTIKDLGEIKHCLNIEFSIDDNEITLSQKGYIRDLLNKFNMNGAKKVATPLDINQKLTKEIELNESKCEKPYRELIGGIMYLATTTRPDIAYAVNSLSQFNNCFTETHWIAAKRILRYLIGTIDFCLRYRFNIESLTGYADADWANCPIDRRSYTGYVFMLSDGPITWEAKKQRTVVLSSTEAEYMGLSGATKEAIYLCNFIKELGYKNFSNMTLYNDSVTAQQLVNNSVFHNRSKRIDVRYDFVREAVERNLIDIKYLRTEDMVADIFTKGLPKTKHIKCVDSLNIKV